MNEDQIRQIIRDELKNCLTINGFLFDANIKILDARNITVGRTNGTKIATAADQKLGFYGATPVTRQGAITAPTGGGSSSSNAIDVSSRAAIVSLIAALHALGLIA
jgi:hypothetical protein